MWGFHFFMEHNLILPVLLFSAFFLCLITFIQHLSERFTFPYTVALLLVGFLMQFLNHISGWNTHISLSPDIIFFILLPVLLFEAAMHINLHQFRLQFKTISFFATFGLLVSMFVVAFIVSLFVGMPIGPSLLFGALISATDPIAVLSLFKSLGAPKRLALLADGESMFNDATGVIAFRLISAFVIGGTVFDAGRILDGVVDFSWVFFGSLIYGTLLGYITSKILPLVKNDRILVNTITAAVALGSFVTAEHYLHVSGVISTVMAGITIGNVGRNKLSIRTINFIEEFWAFWGFIAVSLVFFFASFTLNISIFFGNLGSVAIAIGAVLMGRAVSVYLSAFITNHTPFFHDEPNIPNSWQHILNWSGLRGVIPLVLVYALPDTFVYKQEILGFTLGTLLFTLLVNGLTIKWLLTKLKLHLPSFEEAIISDEMKLFEIQERKDRLQELPKREFAQRLVNETMRSLEEKETILKERLLQISSDDHFLHSLKVQSLEIERTTLDKLYREGRFVENVYYQFESELDMQLDALEYPQTSKVRAVDKKGLLHTRRSYRQQLMNLKRIMIRYPLLRKYFGWNEEELIEERYQLLRARILTSYAVKDYIDKVEKISTLPNYKTAILEVRSMQNRYIEQNTQEIATITSDYPSVIENYQKRLIRYIIQEGGKSIQL